MRRWRDRDREPFAAMNADPEVMRYFQAPLDRSASDAGVDRIEDLFDAQGFGLWALEVADSSDFIGFTGLNPMPEGVPGAGGMEVGWRLARHAWRRGYATEAAVAALEVGFSEVGFDQIWSMTAVVNQPSQNVMRRLGMTPHGRFEHPRIPVGHELRPHVAYRLGRAAWSRSAVEAKHREQDQADGHGGEYAVGDDDGQREVPFRRSS
jgi:RimJ/RimL family protein N-acetyltransferase